MLPTDAFSHNIGPRWIPEAWKMSPAALAEKAKSDLFFNQREIGNVLSGSDRAMAGPSSSPQNESDQVIGASDGADLSRGRLWTNELKDLYRTTPLKAWEASNPGEPNPAP